MTVTPWFISGRSVDLNELMATWTKTLEKVWTSNSSPADWRMWLPRAVWLNWSDPNTWQTRFFDPTTWLPVAFSPPAERERVKTIMTIAGNYIAGDMIEGDMIKDIGNSQILSKSSVKSSSMAKSD